MGAREWIVREGERYRLTQSIPWSLDARRFEAAATDALRGSRRGGRGRAPGRGDGVARVGAGISTGVRSCTANQRVSGISRSRSASRSCGSRLPARWRRRRSRRGATTEAADALRRLVEHDPVDEEASRALIESALRRGERAEALREYRRLERALEDELGVEPGPETAALYKQVRRGAG